MTKETQKVTDGNNVKLKWLVGALVTLLGISSGTAGALAYDRLEAQEASLKDLGSRVRVLEDAKIETSVMLREISASLKTCMSEGNR